MEEKTLDQIAKYLFDSCSSQNLFKSLYTANPYGEYQGKAKAMLDSIVKSIPKYACQNTTFAYIMTGKLAESFSSLILSEKSNTDHDADHSQKQKNADEQFDLYKTLERALESTKDDLGISETFTGLKMQDELLESVQTKGEDRVWGLISSRADVDDIGEEIKKVDASIKSVQQTLRGISTISQAILDGLEKIKTNHADFGYDCGRNLAQIDASEFANLQGKYRQLFLLKYAKGELLQETKEEKKGLGNLIVAVDTSGSTQNKAHGGQTILSLEMGIALAISKIAIKNKCKIRACMHTTRIHGDSGWMSGSGSVNGYFTDIYINKKAVSTGENNFDKILAGICQWIEENQYPSKKMPGVIFVTDGHDKISSVTIERVKNLKKGYGTKLFTYFVAASDPREHAKALIGISDKNYWIEANKPITHQLDAFTELSL